MTATPCFFIPRQLLADLHSDIYYCIVRSCDCQYTPNIIILLFPTRTKRPYYRYRVLFTKPHFMLQQGMFTPAGTPVPEGFEAVDFTGVGLGTCRLYGTEKEVHKTGGCRKAVGENGILLWRDAEGGVWSFENRLCPRFTTPDEKGNVIPDYCFFVV